MQESNPPILQTPSEQQAEKSLEARISELKAAFKGARVAFKKAEDELFYQICFWIIACLVVLFSGIVFMYNLFNVYFPAYWTWQIAYYTAIRIAAISALYAFASFCFKMLRSTLHLYQINKHKQTIIKSLPSFVEAGRDIKKRDLILKRLIELVVYLGNIGIISKEDDFKNNDIFPKINKPQA